MSECNSKFMLSENLFNESVTNFNTLKDKNDEHLSMISLIATQYNLTFKHLFSGNKDEKIDLRSISKPIIALALGIALDEGLYIDGVKLDLNTKMWPFFKDMVDLSLQENEKKLQKVTLKHLITHSIGFDKGLMFSKEIKDKNPDEYLNYIFNTPILHEPGSKFVYSNVGPYLLSVLISEKLGQGLDSWVNNLLFSKLGITEFNWKMYGKYCAGCTGLEINAVDLHKIACLIHRKGAYNSQQIVPESWVIQMTSPQVHTPDMYDKARVLPKYAYGFFMYLCEDGTAYCDGTNGQYLIISKKDVIVTTLGNQSDMKPITVCLKPILDK
ncbi:serine hydrolase domain-containing protein [Vibrio parahaemolyticus]